ncbi:helix-turn-helix domain-containing protein [Paenibacillus koleovorans]|uniref:helix-turn-helix domain-containing protein n=1 Tax=Paenibacillus koleovorans TaxID=121608 RepID=UPI0013E38792|nr:helix-turn-helix domain-containing protein [Paenibacillus koleovorans]
MFGLKSVLYDDRKELAYVAESPTPHHILIYVVGGSVTYWVNGDRLLLRQGDWLFIREGTRRAYDNAIHQKYSAHFRMAEHTRLQPLLEQPYTYRHIRNRDYYKQRFSRLLLEWFDRDHDRDHVNGERAGQELLCEGILLELFGLALKDTRPHEATVPTQELIHTLQTFILHNHTKQLRLTDLADHVDRSPNHVTKLFKQVLRQTPIDYIHQMKVLMAQEMLRSGGMTVAEVSDYLGYCEQSYFHRVFKRFTGLPPSAVARGTRP